MSVHRLAKYQTDDPFTRIPNTAINSGLSLKALGLLVFMLSKPDGWNFTERGLMSQLDTGRHALATAMAELIGRGYVRRTSTSDGNMRRWVTEVYDVPCFDFPSIESPEHREIEALSNNGTEVTNKGSKTITNRRRKTAMVPGWQPKPENLQGMKERYPLVDVSGELDNFTDYWISRGETRADWDASFRTWIRNADKWQQNKKTGSVAGIGTGGVFFND
jgi:hypothetical protein